MKGLARAAVAILVMVGLMFGLRSYLEAVSGISSNSIVFYNWGDYIDPDIITQFEEETGYSVVYETFDSNEAMVAKVEQGGTTYDIVVPSEYMVEYMVEQDLLLELDHEKLPNLQYIDEDFLNHDFDPGNRYSLPYFWGTLGIIYNTSVIEEGSLTVWNDLWDEAYRNQIMIYDGAREVMGIGLQSLGYSLNETDDARLQEATDKLKSLMPNIIALAADEIKMHIVQDEAPIAITFSGEAATAMDEREDLAYVVPEDGSNLWFDNVVIPKNAKNIEGAYALINYLMDPEIAAQNAEYIGYSTPNAAALELMDPEITSNEAWYPSQETMDRLEVYRGLGQAKLVQYNDLYLDIKMQPK
ncbi:ABC transporter substrate-binding protein [Fundicoccus culcitae]|uniref:ABC transporter substrate-binding protein n=1 Tax=Fundicoccus culcitae TaxID=2969821 RepID=A0ABY5P2Z0_9LACT|nr:ABC transporter substrate-binding protein [Fundicoccus culcitae]UUX32803.1 ABC transporter substrate-binding protein [Fundicoccus culcitae]